MDRERSTTAPRSGARRLARVPLGSSPGCAGSGTCAPGNRRDDRTRRAGARSCRGRGAPAFARTNSPIAASTLSPGRGCTPSTAATTSWSERSSVAAASSQSHAPSGYSVRAAAATCVARRVLPTPPTPVSVTIRASRSVSATISSSCSRPTNDVSGSGRLPGFAARVCRGGNDSSSPAPVSWNARSGRERPRKRCSPRSTSAVPSGRAS